MNNKILLNAQISRNQSDISLESLVKLLKSDECAIEYYSKCDDISFFDYMIYFIKNIPIKPVIYFSPTKTYIIDKNIQHLINWFDEVEVPNNYDSEIQLTRSKLGNDTVNYILRLQLSRVIVDAKLHDNILKSDCFTFNQEMIQYLKSL
jgi:hypothetical protein